jgi:hypothetical protein
VSGSGSDWISVTVTGEGYVKVFEVDSSWDRMRHCSGDRGIREAWLVTRNGIL